MPVEEMLVDLAACFEYLSLLDGYSGYNQILIAEEDVPKTAFRCPGALGSYEWVVMPFGLKNTGATYQRAMNAIFRDFIKKFIQPILHSRIGKWALALTKFSLTFKPLKAMKGQIVADFIVDYVMV
ncbi:uncharacterized protein LOC127093810 [Lathyrus oleraceus]|uniref:uncharacterized protein LOC127093810 n=1 Tax=Pisum sativum TaxID=3888 RepID=UPI0021D1410C|nr:uncharacterized protein LOC127093810 [Pisum sativum]